MDKNDLSVDDNEINVEKDNQLNFGTLFMGVLVFAVVSFAPYFLKGFENTYIYSYGRYLFLLAGIMLFIIENLFVSEPNADD